MVEFPVFMILIEKFPRCQFTCTDISIFDIYTLANSKASFPDKNLTDYFLGLLPRKWNLEKPQEESKDLSIRVSNFKIRYDKK